MLNRLQDVFKSFQKHEVWEHRKTVSYQGQEFFILSKEDLIASKRAAGRSVDLEDVRLLETPDAEPHGDRM